MLLQFTKINLMVLRHIGVHLPNLVPLRAHSAETSFDIFFPMKPLFLKTVIENKEGKTVSHKEECRIRSSIRMDLECRRQMKSKHVIFQL